MTGPAWKPDTSLRFPPTRSSSTSPVGPMIADTPVFAATITGRRFSTARNTHRFRCWSSSQEPLNQPSLEMLTRKSAGVGWER